MGFNCGIVGLPNVGKSTLFNALTETAAAEAANYPFCTIEPNIGRVAVPDPRLDQLAALASSANEKQSVRSGASGTSTRSFAARDSTCSQSPRLAETLQTKRVVLNCKTTLASNSVMTREYNAE